MTYLGCALFGLIFLLMMAHGNGSLAARVEHTFTWIHAWAPFSYVIILIVLISPAVSLKIIHSWPKHEEPVDPMAKYRHATDVVDED